MAVADVLYVLGFRITTACSSDLGCDTHMLHIQSPTSVNGNVEMDEYNGKHNKTQTQNFVPLTFTQSFTGRGRKC